MGKKIRRGILIFALILIAGEIAVRIFRIGSDFPYRKSSNPVLLYEYLPGFEGKMWGRPFRTNSSGFRDIEFSLQKPSGVHRTVVLGDSIALGQGLDPEQTFAARLRERLNSDSPERKYEKWEVLNMAVCAYNTVREVELFKEEGVKYSPDLVILQYCLDDIMPSVEETIWETGLNKNWTRLLVWTKDAMFVLRFSRLAQVLRQIIFYQFYIVFESRRVEKMGGLANMLYQESQESWQLVRKSLEDLKRAAVSGNTAVLIVVYPRFEKLEAEYPYREVHEMIVRQCKALEIPVLDLFETFKGMDAGKLRLSERKWDWWHPNAEGNELAAQAIHDFLKQNRNEFFVAGAKRQQ